MHRVCLRQPLHTALRDNLTVLRLNIWTAQFHCGQIFATHFFIFIFFVIFYEKYIQEVCVEEEWLTVSVADSVNQRVGFLQDTVAPRRKVVFCL